MSPRYAWIVVIAGCRLGFDEQRPDGNACGVGVVATFDAGSTSDVTTLTIPQVDVDGGRLLLVAAALPSDSVTWQSATFGGVAMTREGSFSSGSRSHFELWSQIDPAPGARDVQLVATEARAATALALSISGVRNTAPLGTIVRSGGATNASSLLVEASSGDMVIDFMTQGSDAIGRELDDTDLAVPGPEQTERARSQDAAPSRNIRVIASTKPSNMPTTMSWTLSGGYDHVHSAVALHPDCEKEEDDDD